MPAPTKAKPRSVHAEYHERTIAQGHQLIIEPDEDGRVADVRVLEVRRHAFDPLETWCYVLVYG